MNFNEKKKILNEINEASLRQDIIIPLLSKMGYVAPLEYHGKSEKGKDIICFEYDRLNEQRFLSIVAKTGDLTGNVASNQGLMTIVNQIQQSFNNPYENLYNMRQVFINEVWVVTTGKIVSGAEESVMATLRSSNLDKNIRFIGDNRLIELIDKHFSTYWNSNSETKESVVIQRDRLLKFIEQLLLNNNIDRSTIESVKSAILYSDYNPSIKTNIEGLHFSNVSPYSIELSKIDTEYDDYIFSGEYGITKDYFAETKKCLSHSFFDIEETMEHADRISKITNPNEFVEECNSYLVREYPFHQSYGGSASDFLHNLSYLENGLTDLFYFKKFLESKKKLEWAKRASKSITELSSEIEKIIENSEEEVVIHYFISEDGKATIVYDNNESVCFSTNNAKKSKTKRYGEEKEEVIKVETILNFSLSNFRKHMEHLLNYDSRKWITEFEE